MLESGMGQKPKASQNSAKEFPKNEATKEKVQLKATAQKDKL